MRYLLANLLAPDWNWNIDNLNRAIPDLHQLSSEATVITDPRIFKSHATYTEDYPRVMYIYRDGRDACLSYFDYSKKLKSYRHDFATFVDDMLAGNLPHGSWHNHAKGWMIEHKHGALLPICYERLYARPVEELIRIGHFLGRDWGEEAIREAIAKSDFKKIRRDYSELKKKTHWSADFTGGIQRGPGQWRVAFTPELNCRFVNCSDDVLLKLGYPQNARDQTSTNCE